MNYEQMSDFDINRLVAINRGGYQGHVAHMQYGVKESDKDSCGMFHFERDYCNNPSDAWTIIFSSRIMLNPYCADELWKAEVPCGFDGFFKTYATCYHHNPLRAAMIVYLMMKDKEK